MVVFLMSTTPPGDLMPSLAAETVAALAVMSSLPVLAVTEGQIDIIPVSAAITGSFVAGLRPAGHQAELGKSRLKWLSAIIAGASMGVCCAPFIHMDILMMTTVRSAVLIHFLTGLLGAFLVDAILSNPARLMALLGGRVPSDFIPKVEPTTTPEEKK